MFKNKGSVCAVITECDHESDYETDWFEAKLTEDGWLTARDPIFWCLAPAHLEEVVWLFRTAPRRQPKDSKGRPITLLEYYIRMDVTGLLDELWQAPDRLHYKFCLMWSRVTKRRNLSRENLLKHSSGPELDLLFDRDPDLPPSWTISVLDPHDVSIFNLESCGEGVLA